MTMLGKAIAIAAQAHQEQVDRVGESYICHPLRMMLRFADEQSRIVAVLHDVVEDTPWTLDGLLAEGFSAEVVAAVDALTRRDDESYEEFIERLAPNPLARRVKIVDLEDNMDMRRLEVLSAYDLERAERYHRAWLKLRVL